MKSATNEPALSHVPDNGETGSTHAISFVDFFFSSKGRINRSTFLVWQVLALNAVLIAIASLGGIVGGTVGVMVAWIIGSCLTLWPSIAVNVKRCHDRNRSGWFVLLAFLPFLSIWYLIEILILRGTEDNNHYGSDPLLESRKIIWPRVTWATGCIVGILGVVMCASIYASQLVETNRTRRLYRGFDAQGVISMSLSLPPTVFPQGAQQIAAYQEIVKRIEGMPGIDSVGAISPDPVNGGNTLTTLSKGKNASSSEAQLSVRYNVIAGDYFRTMRIPLLSGRFFGSGDKAETMQVSVIDQDLARRGFSGEVPIGERISFVDPDQKNRQVEICGVVVTVQYSLNAPRIPALYVPLTQNPVSRMSCLFVLEEITFGYLSQ